MLAQGCCFDLESGVEYTAREFGGSGFGVRDLASIQTSAGQYSEMGTALGLGFQLDIHAACIRAVFYGREARSSFALMVQQTTPNKPTKKHCLRNS